MPKITLYGPPEAPFVRKVRGALMLKKLEFELVAPSSPEDYRRWSPETGLLPVIEVDGVRVADSARILDYLDQRFPKPPLVSADPKVASSQRNLEAWVEEAFMFYWSNYLRDLVHGGADAEPASRRRTGRGLLRRGQPSRPEKLRAEFARRLDDLANFLGSRPFYYADQLSRADLAVCSFLMDIPGAGGAEVAAGVAARPVLTQHLARVQQVLTGAAE